MAIKQLTDEQIRTWSIEKKDRWWLDNVFRGDVAQFTFRAAACGFVLGFILSMTNLYVGAKTGWTLGVGITSVILAYVLFKAILGAWNGLFPNSPARPYHVLENNVMQSIACAAGYMTAPLISSMAAYMIVMSEKSGAPFIIPWWQAIMWLFGLAVLGVLFAFPMKRRFINDEQQPFPEGRAAGVVMDTLHSQSEGQVSLAPKLLIWTGIISALAKLAQAESVMTRFTHGLLHIPERVAAYIRIPEYLDGWIYALAAKAGFTPNILGVSLKQLTLRPELDIAMIGAGGLMGIRTGVSLMIGACLNYFVLAPIMIQHGDIRGLVSDAGELTFGFRSITEWALWGGVAMMTTASLYAFFSKPQMLISALRASWAAAGRRRTVSGISSSPCRSSASESPLPVLPWFGWRTRSSAFPGTGVPWPSRWCSSSA